MRCFSGILFFVKFLVVFSLKFSVYGVWLWTEGAKKRARRSLLWRKSKDLQGLAKRNRLREVWKIELSKMIFKNSRLT